MAVDSPDIRGELRGAYLKLRRAERHLNCLYSQLTEYNPDLGIGYQLDPESPPVFAEITQPNDELSVFVGDFLSNARAVLEYVAYELHRHHAPDSTARTQFPIYTCGSNYRGDLKPRSDGKVNNQWILDLPNEGQAFLCDLQPYHRSNPLTDPLTALANFSNADKHRSLRPMSVGIPPTTIISDVPGRSDATIEINPTERRADIRQGASPENPEMHMKDGVPFYIVLEDRDGRTMPIENLMSILIYVAMILGEANNNGFGWK